MSTYYVRVSSITPQDDDPTRHAVVRAEAEDGSGSIDLITTVENVADLHVGTVLAITFDP